MMFRFRSPNAPALATTAWRGLVGALAFVALQATAQPDQRPLLTVKRGAKPNLMIAIDNSGSMAFTYHESYNVTDDAEQETRQCPSPYSRSSSATLATFNAGVGGDAIVTGTPGNYTYTCYERYRIFGSLFGTRARTNVSVSYPTPVWASANWSAQRSADVNPQYYNPRVRYLPRVDGSGNARAPVGNGTVKFVSNQQSASFDYDVLENNSVPGSYRVYHSMYADDGVTKNFQDVVNDDNPTGFTSRYNLEYSLRIPQHITYTNPGSSTPAFTYAYCTDVVVNALGQETGCRAHTKVNVKYGASDTFTIGSPHNRTDCTNGVCSTAKEITNILNWFHWYATRQMATSTAISLSLADIDEGGAKTTPSTLDKELRIGYLPINDITIPNDPEDGGNTNLAIQTIPGSVTDTLRLRGVRTLERGTQDNTDLFDWLDKLIPRGATPLHNAIQKVADYYMVKAGVNENAWRTVPTSSSSEEKSCRRSFNLLFSDGGWTGKSNIGEWIAPNPAGPDHDNTDYAGTALMLSNGTRTKDFGYLRSGATEASDRALYTPFPSTATGGLADLTAGFHWHTDFRSALPNEVQARNGQPTTWQNMTTYTVGYLVRPSGELRGATSGLTYAKIDQYKKEFAESGFATATKPAWPTGNLLDDTTSTQSRVDDFIQAGFTGGGRSFSARTAQDIKDIFDAILVDILGASGVDAGVAVSSGGDSGGSANATLADQLKYGVSYRTLDNSGDITAYKLDAQGNQQLDASGNPEVVWRASQKIPAHNLRRIFTMSGQTSPTELNGAFSLLPSDVRGAIKQGPDQDRVANDSSFIDYLRGKDPVADPSGVLFRQRSSLLGAMVNPPSIFMGGKPDSAYDLRGDIEGRTSYRAFTDSKRAFPASLFVATNAGMMHALSAKTGDELAAVMPRRGLKRMLAYADESYNFQYILDGPLSQHDVYDTRPPTPDKDWKRWKHIATGTGGRGEPLIYAVESPLNSGATSTSGKPDRIPDRTDFLWEIGPEQINSTDDRIKMGYITNPLPLAGQTLHRDSSGADKGLWIVVTTSGHYNGDESTGKNTGLVVLNPMTGAVLARLPLPSTVDAGRGLSGVTILRDTEGTNRIVGAYAGDAKGNLWRFNLKGDPSTWGVAYGGKPLFSEPNNRPIYGTPAWQPHPKGGHVVVFATGMALEQADLDDQGTHHIYGIWDPTPMAADDVSDFTTVQSSELQTQEVLTGTATPRNGNTYFKTTTNKLDWKVGAQGVHRGWRLSLGYRDAGERSIAEVQNMGPNVVISTTVLKGSSTTSQSEEICEATQGGNTQLPPNYLYVLRGVTGHHTRGHDIDRDGKLDDFSVANLPSGGFARGNAIVNTPKSAEVAVEDPNDTSGGLYGSSDEPKSPLPDSVRLTSRINEAGGESRSGCNKSLNEILGVGTESSSIGVDCPSVGWSRTQYQLSGPPAN
jgi:type IV pilus assembly protein PilY1